MREHAEGFRVAGGDGNNNASLRTGCRQWPRSPTPSGKVEYVRVSAPHSTIVATGGG